MIKEFVLLVFAHVGPMGDGNSNALTTVPGFANQEDCKRAGEVYKGLAGGSTKIITTACVAREHLSSRLEAVKNERTH